MKDSANEKLTVVSVPGGFGGAPAAPESTCNPYGYHGTYTVDKAAQELSWDVCRLDAPNVYSPHIGQRALTESELASVEEKLGQLVVGTPEGYCGPDAGFLTLDVETDASTARYISSSSCPMQFSAGRAEATGIAELSGRLQELSDE